ncbi:MAG: hypothetical protein STHCBS139747_003675 [Sporothrix thermara]
MAKFDLKGRLAVITGGARGCGLAFAQGLAEAGADVALFDVIDPVVDLAALSAEFSVTARYYRIDVSARAALEQGFAAVEADFPGRSIDVVVACAGVNKDVAFLETTEADFSRLFDVNARGVYFTAQVGAQAMLRTKTKVGSIVLVASIASHMAIRSQRSSAYCGTKGAVRAMVAPIAAELAPLGIRVNSISPGYVRTEMTAPFPHLLESWKDEILNGRVAEPDDIKGACVFLASDASSYCTAADFRVDGGVTMW